MAEWYQVGLPEHLTWYGSAPFWRSAVIAESRKASPSAFTGRNLLRVFQPLHTQHGVALDLIMALIDVPRERIVLAAFPGFLGATTGSGIPMPTAEQMAAMRRGENVSAADVPVIGGDEGLRDAAARAEQRIAAENNVRQQSILGPDNSKWSVYLQEFSSRPAAFLESDGHTLTLDGANRVKEFVRGVVLAAREWVPDRDGSRRSEVEVQVQKVSPMTGPSLQESLAPSAQTPQQQTKTGGCYVATAVYGSYDNPNLWVLRRWRDNTLLGSALGRIFVRSYYAVSPKLVARLGHRRWFVNASRSVIDRLVVGLRRRGVPDSPYQDH